MKTKHKPKSRRPRIQLDKHTLALRHDQALKNLFFKTLEDVPNSVRAQWLKQLDDGLQVLLVTRGTQRQMVQAFRDVTDTFNLSEQLIREGHTTGMDALDAARAAMVAMYYQVKEQGYIDSAWTLTGTQVAALRDGREAFAQQMAHAGISGAEWLRAVDNTSRRCSLARTRAKPGEISDGVLVVDLAMPD